jgi:hypothetical protein
MNFKTMLGVLALGGLIALTNPPQAAKALSLIDPNLVLTPSGKMTTEVSSRRSQVKHRQWRHRGGRHPFYGSGH